MKWINWQLDTSSFQQLVFDIGTHLQEARYVARPGPAVVQLDNFMANAVGQWAPIDVGAAQLIDTRVTCVRTECGQIFCIYNNYL